MAQAECSFTDAHLCAYQLYTPRITSTPYVQLTFSCQKTIGEFISDHGGKVFWQPADVCIISLVSTF